METFIILNIYTRSTRGKFDSVRGPCVSPRSHGENLRVHDSAKVNRNENQNVQLQVLALIQGRTQEKVITGFFCFFFLPVFYVG